LLNRLSAPSIAALEGRHGAKLFNRVGRRIELTEAGALFLAEARAVLARAESAELVLSELGDLKRGVLSVHASQTITGYWLPRHLVAFRRSYPGVAIRLSMVNTSQTAVAVRGGEADLGFVEGVGRFARPALSRCEGLRHPLRASDHLVLARVGKPRCSIEACTTRRYCFSVGPRD
jgi:DNA-binding transcriptional LysR family regulator